MRIRRDLCALAVALAMVAVPVIAEVWNDPGGVSVTATSQQVDLGGTPPRPMSSVFLFNDDATNSVFARVFPCDETPAAAVPSTDDTTGSVEIKPGTGFTFPHDTRTEGGIAYCWVTLVCRSAETATARVVAK